MIAHVVLFRPKPSLSDDERAAFVAALDEALHHIPRISRARVGRRSVMGRTYDAHNPQEFPFMALLEFETKADLVAYLDHPAHRTLGEQFYTAAEAALALDFELLDRTETQALLR